MSRALINLIGIVVMVGVLALGIFLVAAPVAFQALGVIAQTATVGNTNAVYQTQIDHLTEEQKRLPEIEASVAALQTQITPANDLDDVFELVATAAAATGVNISAVTAEDAVAYSERTAAVAGDEAAAQPAPQPTPDPSATPATSDPQASSTTTQPESAPTTTGAGRTQVGFTINVTAPEFGQLVAFLDALRSGPRLLGQVKTTVTPTDGGYDLTLSALTFVLTTGGVTP